MKVLVALLLLGLLAGAFAHKHKHHKHHDDKDEIKHQLRVCHYKATDGSEYDLRLMNRTSKPMSIQDTVSKGYVYFRPCRSVALEGCDSDAAICLMEPSGKAINFGSAQEIQWADGVEDGTTIEATYANGEVCSTGIPRKTVVEYRCSLQKPAPGVAPASSPVALESRIVSADVQPCFIHMVVESPHACPTTEYCHSINIEQVCASATEGLCVWTNKGHCVAASEECGIWRHASPVQIMAIVTLLTLFISICLGLCCCACRAARMSRKARKIRAQKQEMEKMVTELEEVPELEQAPAEPTAPQFQPIPIFYPGQQIPMSPYSMQGYPVIQFMPIPQQSKTEETA